MARAFLAVLTAAQVLAAAAVADTLDFTTLAGGNLGGSVTLDGVVIEGKDSLRNQSNRYFESAGGAICAQRGSNANCRGNVTVAFDGKVKKLSFNSAGYQAGDVATILLYHRKSLLGSTGVAWNGKVDLAAFRKVTRIKIEYEGVGDGMAFGKFNFTPIVSGQRQDDGGGYATLRPAVPQVPAPAGLPLLAAALGLLWALGLPGGRRTAEA